MSLATLNDNIKNHAFKRCYLLFGEEPFMIRHYKNALKNAVLGNGDKMNLSTFTGKVTDINSIIEIAETLPFFTDYRCILIENSGLFSSANELSEYIDKIPESTVIIFAEAEVDNKAFQWNLKYRKSLTWLMSLSKNLLLIKSKFLLT